jgi:hypothetical protein
MKWLWDALKGAKTYFSAAFVAVLGVLELANWTEIIPDGNHKGYVLVGIAALFAALRSTTKGPAIGQKP